LFPYDSRLHLSTAKSQIVVFWTKGDEISLLTVNSSSSLVNSLSLSLGFPPLVEFFFIKEIKKERITSKQRRVKRKREKERRVG
jgi:hypothetical protein